MTTALGVVIGLLLLVILWQHRKAREIRRQLLYIHDKLNHILDQGTRERMLLFSSNPELRVLLTDLNRLLDAGHRGDMERVRLETAMRGMLANVSHDLKTPLTVVLGYIETLLHDENMSAAEREAVLRSIHRKAEEVITLMNTFFDLAKLESGDKNLPLSRVNLNEVCRKNILAFYEILSSKGTEVRIDIPEDKAYMLGNEEALDRILSNLISNAITYGDAGNVVGLRLLADDQEVTVEIWDRGKGITAAHQDQVFERLYTLEDSRNRNYQGSGLGLTITKRLTEGMNGRISLVSKPYEQTVFAVSFPRLTY